MGNLLSYKSERTHCVRGASRQKNDREQDDGQRCTDKRAEKSHRQPLAESELAMRFKGALDARLDEAPHGAQDAPPAGEADPEHLKNPELYPVHGRPLPYFI
jgi:hypothetical protein